MKRLSVLLAVMVCIMSGCVVVPYHHHDPYYYGYPGGYYQYHHDWQGHRHYRR